MFRVLQTFPIYVLVLIATILEASGDAVVRLAIYKHVGAVRAALLMTGAALLLGYGSFVNTAPVEFGRIVGIYIAMLFVVWQAINFLVFRSAPGVAAWAGGLLIITGGVIVTFWRA